jgi:hypothetical protein
VSRRRRAAWLAVASGVLLVLAGASGSARLWELLLAYAAQLFPDAAPLAQALALILAALASLGGFTVILGASALFHGRRLLGRFLVGLGAGASVLGLLVTVAIAASQGRDPLEVVTHAFSGLAGAGVVCALLSEVTA